MSHTFLALDMNLIPQTTKDNVPSFWLGKFSNDDSRLLIDGYNSEGVLVHPEKVLLFWLQWSDNPLEIIDLLIDTAIPYTEEEILLEFNKPDSIWYNGSAEEENE